MDGYYWDSLSKECKLNDVSDCLVRSVTAN